MNNRLILHEKFLEMQMRNPRFTLRAYARKVGISSGALSELLSGKRKLTAKNAQRIAIGLGLDPSEFSALTSAGPSAPQSESAPAVNYERLADDQFHLISDWWHYAILNLIKTKDFRGESSWVAQRLGLSEAVVDRAVLRLTRLGLLKISTRGRWSRTSAKLETSDDVMNISVRRSHLQDLELARTSLESDAVEIRDFTSMTFAINKSKVRQAKSFIRKFQDDFCQKFELDEPTDVYRLSLQLFPLTKK